MCPGSNRRGSGKAAQLITCEIKKSLGFVLACALRGGSWGSLDQWTGWTLHLPSQRWWGQTASQSGKFPTPWYRLAWLFGDLKPRVLICKDPLGLPGCKLEDRAGFHVGSRFSELGEVKKGHPFWGPILSGGTEGPEDGHKMSRRGSTLGSRATSPFHTASGLAPQTQVPFSVCHQGCPTLPWGHLRGAVSLSTRAIGDQTLYFLLGRQHFLVACATSLPLWSLFLCLSALVSPR